MTPSEVGERTEVAVMAALVDAGLQVLVPFGGYHRFDLAFADGDRFVKVQCKSGRVQEGVVVFATSDHTVGLSRDYRGEADLFGVYCYERREVYLVPVEDVPLRLAHLRVEPPKNNQKAGIRMADQYLVRDGRLPDAVVQRFTRAGNSPDRTRGIRPSRVTSPQLVLASMNVDDTLASANIDIGETMPIPVALAEDQAPVTCCAPISARRLSDEEAVATSTLFKALADPHRVRVMNLLSNATEPVCVCDITAYLGLSQSTVSFHLKKLVNSGLLAREQRGTWGYYSINAGAMRTLNEVVSKGAAA